MDRFFNPRSVAVIGASVEPLKGGHSLVLNLKQSLPERLYPINPSYSEVCGLPCFKDVASLPEPVDLAIVFVPAPLIPDIIEQCAKKGILRVVIQSAGFAETGEKGRILQDQCMAMAQRYGIRLWGPNCMGFVNGHTRMVASFMRPALWPENLKPGGVSLIVQSGMLSAGFLMQILSEGYFGLSKACSIGNRADVNECDLLEYFVTDDNTKVVGIYLESLLDPQRFRRAISRLNRPVILLKGGLTPDGAMAAQSHTASLAGNAEVTEGFFRQLGVHRAYDFVELMDLLRAAFLWQERGGTLQQAHLMTQGRGRIAVVSFSGAAGIVASDHLARHGMGLAEFSPETLEILRSIFPPWMRPENPVDIYPATERNGHLKTYLAIVDAMIRDPQVDGIFLHVFVDRIILDAGLPFLEPLGASSKPVVIWNIGDARCFREFRDRAAQFHLPTFTEIQRAAKALGLLMRMNP